MYMRTLLALCLLITVTSGGCANMMTSQAIESFSDSLAAADVEELRATTSERFEQQALRLPEAAEDFRILDLPTGETSVLNVEDVSEDMKHVTVEIGDEGEDKETLEYHLTRGPDGKDWVVDDIYTTQQLPGSQSPVTKSVSEQMDLLLTVREFITAWREGAREDVLDFSTVEFRTTLAEISPAHLHQLTQQFLEGVGGRSLRPKAQMENELALVVVPASRGSMIIQFEREDNRWRVANLSPSSSDDVEPLSARRLAIALQTGTHFLKAYERADRAALSKLATEDFFASSLVAADLASVPLPVTRMMAMPYELHFHGEHIDLVLPTDAATYVLTMNDTSSDLPPIGEDASPGVSYAVNEVTVYESETGQVKLLSSVFTTQAVVELYASALGVWDRSTLMALSTSDFNDRAWSQVDDVILSALPLREIEASPPQLIASVFNGATVEMTVTQGSHALTYVLRASQGRMLVDDVLLPVTRRPVSLKTNIEVLAPLYGFARGIHHNNLEMLRQHSGSGLDRKIWSQTTTVPDIGFALSEHLILPIHSIQHQSDQSLVRLTDGIRETHVSLVRENDLFVVQDVQLSVGDGFGQQVTMLNAMRDQLTQRFATEQFAPAGEIVPAGYDDVGGADSYVDPL